MTGGDADRRYFLGVDVGGTFTDVVLGDSDGGLAVAKVSHHAGRSPCRRRGGHRRGARGTPPRPEQGEPRRPRDDPCHQRDPGEAGQ